MKYQLALLAALVVPGCSAREARVPGDQIPAPEHAAAFMLGSWRAADGGPEEHWVAMAGAVYGVTLFADDFEVMIVDEDPPAPGDGPRQLTMLAMPGGRPPVRFPAEQLEDALARFANPDHDFPTWIQYDLPTPESLRAQVGGPGRDPIVVSMASAQAEPAPELEEADRTFDVDTAEGGAAAWAAHFDEGGAMMASGDRRIEGREAIEAHMAPALAEHALRWTPRASGRRGDRGFTVGEYTLRRRSDGDTVDTGSYVTVWQVQPDGGWAVIFDVGRPRGAPAKTEAQ